MANINGWSITVGGGFAGAVAVIATTVAAAAVVPLSSTATKALCITALMCSLAVGLMSEKSASSEKAMPIPNDPNAPLRLVP